MKTYARQGGTSNIFINDDGLQLLSKADRKDRIDFYNTHNIGWVARPPHNSSDPDGFKRAGRFKKASNMNYALAMSLKMEHCLSRLEALLVERHQAYTGSLRSIPSRSRLRPVESDPHLSTHSSPESVLSTLFDDDEDMYKNLEYDALQMALEETFEANGSK